MHKAECLEGVDREPAATVTSVPPQLLKHCAVWPLQPVVPIMPLHWQLQQLDIMAADSVFKSASHWLLTTHGSSCVGFGIEEVELLPSTPSLLRSIT